MSGTSQKFDRGTFLNFKAAAPEAAGAAATIKPSWTFWEEVECDNSVAVANSTGCVFAKNTPTWQTNTKRYPAAAAYYWVMREKLADHPGSKKYNKPMHRMTDKVQQEHNRTTICNKTGAGKWTAHPDATGDTQGVQCDEFPFAATLESGGIPTPVVNGGICAQLFAQKQDDGTWRLFDDDGYDPPTWKEICGRASMPGKQNGDAGRGPGLSGFFTKARVQNGGAFYMEIPQMEGCNPDDVCVIRP
ncbi:NucA/NucB deoxyribonuclease domain-containing protein [Streptomyces mirabilis]|uniref:NucA/NucB deoxyribonuclease domain-containing protein n=1 Tax=Streptomyces mirabilis TaxID=68239 RepID=UPI0036B39922